MEYEPEARSACSIAQWSPPSHRNSILVSRVPGTLKEPLKAGSRFQKRIKPNGHLDYRALHGRSPSFWTIPTPIFAAREKRLGTMIKCHHHGSGRATQAHSAAMVWRHAGSPRAFGDGACHNRWLHRARSLAGSGCRTPSATCIRDQPGNDRLPDRAGRQRRNRTTSGSSAPARTYSLTLLTI